MKTTIFSPVPDSKSPDSSQFSLFLAFNLFLSLQYLVMIILLLMVPVRHGRGGGMGSIMNLSQPYFILLFSFLILCHLIAGSIPHPSGRVKIISGFGLVITAAMTLGLLLFSRQVVTILQEVYREPILIYCILILSLGYGIFLIIRQIRHGQVPGMAIPAGDDISFPLPGKYIKERILAQGGIGTIWYAQRLLDGRPVVVKVPRRDDENTGMSFMQEIHLWRELSHENIAAILSANILPVPYMEIEYLPGSVADLSRPVPVEKALFIIRGLVSALIYAHDKGVIHCDIKPTNILLTEKGIPKLTDWGLARSDLSRWPVWGFSPRYAAPEQRHNPPECGIATDIWQTGMVFAELITGTAEVPDGSEPVFQGEYGSRLLPVIRRCFKIQPKDRYLSARDLMADLEIINRSDGSSDPV